MSGSVAVGAGIVDALIGCGVDRLVVAPGSRSAPLAVPAARRELEGSLDLSVRVDERSAAFLALGMSKASGAPTAVVCTSGTAAANFLPAVVEARYSGAPLVVLTADRPAELRGRGASQTIDQAGMFDRFVVGSWDLSADCDVREAAETVCAAVGMARRTHAPVHINVAFRPPLHGTAPLRDTAPVQGAPPADSGDGPAAGADGPSAPPRVDLGEVPARGVIIAGHLDVGDAEAASDIAELARRLGWPIVHEATSQLRGAPTAVHDSTRLLSDPELRRSLRPDLVLTVGLYGLDRGVLALVAEAARHVSVRLRPRSDPPDPMGTAEQILDTVPHAANTPDPRWLDSWREAAGPLAPPAGPVADAEQVIAGVRAQMSADDLLVVAPSLTIRAAAAGSGAGPAVLANRGANGIDGVVSTAWGAASVWRGGRTVAVLGDLALLHDVTGLLAPQVERRPDLVLVVADNNGGGIFGQLEHGAPEYEDVFERVFGTPHDRDLARILAAAGIEVFRADGPGGFALPAGSGVRAVIVPVSR